MMTHRFAYSLLGFGTLALLAGCALGQAQFASIEPTCAQNPGACKQMCAVNRNSTECAVATVQTAEAIASQGNPDHLSGPSLGELRRQLLVICNQGVKRGCTAYAQVGDMIMSTVGPKQSTALSSGSETGGPAASSTSSERPPANGEVVLYDPTSNVQDPNVTMLVGSAALEPQESKRVLDRIFRGRYLTDRKRCRTAPDNLAAARQSGNVVPSIFQVARGSFTKPHASQTLYLVTTGECWASHADNFGSDQLVVIDGDEVVAHVIDGGSSIHGVVDLDGDGRHEVLLTRGLTATGTTTEWATLARIDQTGLATIKDFGQVSGNTCFGIGAKTESHSIIHAKPGSPPEFQVEKKSGSCEAMVQAPPPPTASEGTIGAAQTPQTWALACARIAHIHLNNTGRPVSPMALAAPSLSCIATLREAKLSVANATVACIQTTQAESCLAPIGGPAALARPMQ